MKVLVTGGAGFIGSHIGDALIARGDEVVVIDDLRMGVNNAPRGALFGCVPLEEYMETPPGIEAIVHCAARADVSQNWTHGGERRTLLESNVLGTVRLLERHPGVPVVFLSTQAVYGDAQGATEDTVPTPESPYAASKLSAEAYVQAYAHRFGAPWHILRLGVVAGARYHHGHAKDFVTQMRTTGRIHARDDGSRSKSAVSVHDVVEAVCLALRNDLPSGLWNLGTEPWTWRQTVKLMEEMVQTQIVLSTTTTTKGWIGDPHGHVLSTKYEAASGKRLRPVEPSFKEALEYMGWPRL